MQFFKTIKRIFRCVHTVSHRSNILRFRTQKKPGALILSVF